MLYRSQAKNWTDLLNGEKFNKKDVITLQDPCKPEARDMNNFKHMHEHYMASKSEKEAAPEAPSNIRMFRHHFISILFIRV